MDKATSGQDSSSMGQMDGGLFEVDIDSSDANAKGVGGIFQAIAKTMEQLENDRRFSFDIEIREKER